MLVGSEADLLLQRTNCEDSSGGHRVAPTEGLSTSDMIVEEGGLT